MNTENNNNGGLRLELYEDNGDCLYLVAWRGETKELLCAIGADMLNVTCELLCVFDPARNSAEEVAQSMRGLLCGELKPADFEEGEWVDERLAGCETEAERANARAVAFGDLQQLRQVWCNGMWQQDWGTEACWTQEVRLWCTKNPQELPSAEFCERYAETVQFREEYSVEQTHDETMELLYRAAEGMVWSLDMVEGNMETLARIARRGFVFHWSPGFWAQFEDAEGEKCEPEKAVSLFLECERVSMRGDQGKRECDGSDMLHFVANRIAAANKWELECDYDRDGDSESLSIALPRA